MNKVEARAPWVGHWGYSRAVRQGSLIEVGGTTAGTADGAIVGLGDPYAQAKYALSVIVEAVGELGGTAADIVRTRAFLRNIDDWQEVGRAHLEVFGHLLPTSTCVGGLVFLHPDLLVEIEATAFLGEDDG